VVTDEAIADYIRTQNISKDDEDLRVSGE